MTRWKEPSTSRVKCLNVLGFERAERYIDSDSIEHNLKHSITRYIN